MAIEMGIKEFDVYGDSQLVIKQLLEEYNVQKDYLITFHRYMMQLLNRLETIKLDMFLGVLIRWPMHL